jgi:hypothetical protein
MRAGVRANPQRVRVGGSVGESVGFEREKLTKIVPSIPLKNARLGRCDFSVAKATLGPRAVLELVLDPVLIKSEERRQLHRQCVSACGLLPGEPSSAQNPRAAGNALTS